MAHSGVTARVRNTLPSFYKEAVSVCVQTSLQQWGGGLCQPPRRPAPTAEEEEPLSSQHSFLRKELHSSHLQFHVQEDTFTTVSCGQVLHLDGLRGHKPSFPLENSWGLVGHCAVAWRVRGAQGLELWG